MKKVEKKEDDATGRNSGYLVRESPTGGDPVPGAGSALPAAERYRPPSLPFSRYKEQSSGAVDPALLLLTEKPFDYIRDSDSAAIVNPYLPAGPLPNQISFQEGAAAANLEGDDEGSSSIQGTLPAEGSIDAPRTRPERPRPVSGPNRFRAPAYRPRRPGGPAGLEQTYQTGFGAAESSSSSPTSPLLSSEVVLPPVDPNNPNFAPVVRNTNGNGLGRRRPPGPPRAQQQQSAQYPYDPYFPPNYPGAFPNQYPPNSYPYPGYPPPQPYPYQPPPAPAASSSSTSTSGNGAAASASSTGTVK